MRKFVSLEKKDLNLEPLLLLQKLHQRNEISPFLSHDKGQLKTTGKSYSLSLFSSDCFLHIMEDKIYHWSSITFCQIIWKDDMIKMWDEKPYFYTSFCRWSFCNRSKSSEFKTFFSKEKNLHMLSFCLSWCHLPLHSTKFQNKP